MGGKYPKPQTELAGKYAVRTECIDSHGQTDCRFVTNPVKVDSVLSSGHIITDDKILSPAWSDGKWIAMPDNWTPKY